MRKLIIIIMFLFINSDVWASASTGKELFTLVHIMEEENYTIEHWRIVMKEKISDDQLTRIKEKLQQTQSLTKDENKRRLKYISTMNNELFTITYQLLIPKNLQNSLELIVVLEGETWSDNHREVLSSEITHLTTNYFTDQPKSYTCLNATNNDIINQVNTLNNLKQKLNLNVIDTQLDTIQSTNMKIIYGFTPRWDNNMHIYDQRLNIQIVSWEEEKNKIIIGTPILITEY